VSTSRTSDSRSQRFGVRLRCRLGALRFTSGGPGAVRFAERAKQRRIIRHGKVDLPCHSLTSIETEDVVPVDAEVRAFADALPVFEPASTPCTRPTPLAEARIAIVTTAGLRTDGDLHWKAGDESFHVLPGDGRGLGLAHMAPNFDRTGFVADLNVVFPIDRLAELADRGVIRSVASRHFSFMGGQPSHELATMRLDTGPQVAQLLRDDDVDVVLLTGV
jgi:D-proline reductase (dithiol) PrdB